MSDRNENDTLCFKTKTFVLVPSFKNSELTERLPEDRLEETLGLAEAIDLEVLGSNITSLNKITPSLFFGKGIIEKIKEQIDLIEIELVIIDWSLSPVQQRNLENAWKVKVIDRTALILEIFGERARTHEGSLQVELASLSYERSRLVRSWTHLERQRGGYGFLGGPGEKQIEMDRRILDARIKKLQKELDKVKKTRFLHRKSRDKAPYPVIALVGYTNAGKSTLFNQLVDEKVLAKDMLFATLDPTMRLLELSPGKKVILSDTVGFIADLPTELVAAFRATLEEVEEADLILHVRDVTSKEFDVQKHEVEKVLKNLGINIQEKSNVLEVFNKVDLMDSDNNLPFQNEKTVAISAITGEGFNQLISRINDFFNKTKQIKTYKLLFHEGKKISWLFQNTDILEKEETDEGFLLTVRSDEKTINKFNKLFE